MTGTFESDWTTPIEKSTIGLTLIPSEIEQFLGVKALFQVFQFLGSIITIKKTQKDYEYDQKRSRIFVEELTR